MMRLLGVVSSWILLFSWQLSEPNRLWLIDLQLLSSWIQFSKHSWTLSTVNDLITLLMRMRPSITTSNVASTLHGRRRIRHLEYQIARLLIEIYCRDLLLQLRFPISVHLCAFLIINLWRCCAYNPSQKSTTFQTGCFTFPSPPKSNVNWYSF